MKTIGIEITFNEEALGTASSNPDVHKEFIASKGPDAKTIEEEVAAIGADAVVEKAMTIFPKENGKPFVYDYQWKGYFKDVCSALSRVAGTRSRDLKAYKKVIDGLIFPQPRKIFIEIPAGMAMGNCQRPLRAQTAQGERIALANSETVPAGSKMRFNVKLLDDAHEKLIVEWMDYGELKGFSQWRSAGKGRFSWKLTSDSAKIDAAVSKVKAK